MFKSKRGRKGEAEDSGSDSEPSVDNLGGEELGQLEKSIKLLKQRFYHLNLNNPYQSKAPKKIQLYNFRWQMSHIRGKCTCHKGKSKLEICKYCIETRVHKSASTVKEVPEPTEAPRFSQLIFERKDNSKASIRLAIT